MGAPLSITGNNNSNTRRDFSIEKSGAFQDLYSSGYDRTYSGDLVVQIDPDSLNLVGFQNSHYASGHIDEVRSEA
jgi:hypothetical protein